MRTLSSHTGPAPWETLGTEAQGEAESLRRGMFSPSLPQGSGAQTTLDASVCGCEDELLTGNSLPGQCQGQRNQVQTGTLLKPSIWANPGTIITRGSSVTIWCQGSLQAKPYRLYKERVSHYWNESAPLNSKDKVSFSTEYMDVRYAGQLWCAYHSWSGWSEWSDSLLVVMTGAYSKPSLSAHPSPLVPSGEKVSLLCSSKDTMDTFHLLKEGGAHPSQHRKSLFFPGRHQATFPVNPVSTSHGGTYRCYGSSRSSPQVWSYPRDPLDLKVTGAYSKPSLSAHPSPLVTSGGKASLMCSSNDTMDTFHLLKEKGASPPQHRKSQFSPGRHQATFPVNPVSTSHGGTYRCYGSSRSSPQVWSHPSDPLDLKVTGKYKKPSLSAHPGPSVTSGESVTLQCCSDDSFDTFHLFKEGFIAPPQRLHWQNNTGPFQSNFTMSPVTSAHGGTYRCYSSHSTSPYLLSQPSDPLELVVSGEEPLTLSPQCSDGRSKDQRQTPREPDPLMAVGPRSWWPLFFSPSSSSSSSSSSDTNARENTGQQCQSPRTEACQRAPAQPPRTRRRTCERERRCEISGNLAKKQVPLVLSPPDAAVIDKQPEEEMELDSRQSPEDENPQASVYSRSRRGVTTSPSSLSEELQDMKDRQVEEGSQRDSQAAALEDPQEVTYAQLNHSTLRQETTTSPSSQSGKPSGEPSIYAALASH
ncbi:LOW QUALITY PROTEIN: leukocyte immunoglobulin-like receptor subfamily B member 3 [Dugong dugon]